MWPCVKIFKQMENLDRLFHANPNLLVIWRGSGVSIGYFKIQLYWLKREHKIVGGKKKIPNWIPLEHVSMFCEELKKKTTIAWSNVVEFGRTKLGGGGGMGPTSLEL
jgi:hypothetical protein